MFFSSKKSRKKKELWRLRVDTTIASITAASNQQDDDQQLPINYHHDQQQLYYPSLTTDYNQFDYTNNNQSPIHHPYRDPSPTIHHQLDTYLNGQQRMDCSQTPSPCPSESSVTFGNCCAPILAPPSPASNPGDLKEMFSVLFRMLKEPQMDTLKREIDQAQCCDIGKTTNCILVKRCTIVGEQPHVVACRIWRWPDLKYAEELKRMPWCPTDVDRIYVCCNPSHWQRLSQPDTPPPPYRFSAMEESRTGDQVLSENRVGGCEKFQGSLTTDGEEFLTDGWCQLAYWELTQRVGRLFPVDKSYVNVFADQMRGDGMCLTTLVQQRLTRTPDAVVKARKKIGLGVTISKESDGIWLYNRSSSPVFVHSPTLNDVDTFALMVYRVSPGHCLRAFDPNRALNEPPKPTSYIAGAQTGPIDVNSVRISFAKGWGPRYKRQEVTACPCWLEILLVPCR